MRHHRKPITRCLSAALALTCLAACGGNEPAHATSAHKISKSNGAPVSFANDIQPIFDARCISCHDDVLLRGGLDLTAPNARANLVDQPTSDGCLAEVPDSVRVVAGDTSASMLWRKTLPADTRCRNPMPLLTDGLGIIAPDEFALIEQWIAQGALDN